MIELIFVACSIVNGARCHEFSLTYADVSLMTCMVHGQQPIADWLIVHPNWRVAKYRCQIPGTFAKL